MGVEGAAGQNGRIVFAVENHQTVGGASGQEVPVWGKLQRVYGGRRGDLEGHHGLEVTLGYLDAILSWKKIEKIVKFTN